MRYVLVLTDQPTAPGVPDTSHLTKVAATQDAVLYDIGAAGVQHPPAPGADRYLGLVGGAAAVLLAAVAWGWSGVRRARRAAPTEVVDHDVA